MVAFDDIFCQGRVSQKVSSRGKYVSVNIGPICVVSSEQVSLLWFMKTFKENDQMQYANKNFLKVPLHRARMIAISSNL
jgi:Protein of unknown function (DUF493)